MHTYLYIYIYVHILHLESRWCNSFLCPFKYQTWEWLDNYLHMGEDPELHSSKPIWQWANHHLIRKYIFTWWVFAVLYKFIGVYVDLPTRISLNQVNIITTSDREMFAQIFRDRSRNLAKNTSVVNVMEI